jgi:hypothetical protein
MDDRIVDTARRDLESLRTDIAGWIARRTGRAGGAEYAAHYSQLIAVREWFAAILDHFAGELARRPDRERARKLRGPLFALGKLWGRVRDRLQQREVAGDPRVWRGADDVAHACYAPTLVRARALCGEGRFPSRPPPLPFMSPEWGARPLMFDPGDLPREFADALAGEALRAFRLSWPLPMVMLPTTCIDSPWWLVMLGHEVGHAIHFDLALRQPLADALAGAAASAGHPEPARWADWSAEVFADAYSALTIGRAAVLALLEVVYDDPARMRETADPRHYPPPAIRVELMRRLAITAGSVARDDHLGVDLPALLDGGSATRELPVIDAIVAALRGPLPTLGCGLPQLCEYNGRATAPREVIAGKFLEYAGGASDLDGLRDRTLAALAEAAPGGTREGAPARLDGPALAGLLLAGEWQDPPE